MNPVDESLRQLSSIKQFLLDSMPTLRSGRQDTVKPCLQHPCRGTGCHFSHELPATLYALLCAVVTHGHSITTTPTRAIPTEDRGTKRPLCSRHVYEGCRSLSDQAHTNKYSHDLNRVARLAKHKWNSCPMEEKCLWHPVCVALKIAPENIPVRGRVNLEEMERIQFPPIHQNLTRAAQRRDQTMERRIDYRKGRGNNGPRRSEDMPKGNQRSFAQTRLPTRQRQRGFRSRLESGPPTELMEYEQGPVETPPAQVGNVSDATFLTDLIVRTTAPTVNQDLGDLIDFSD